MDIRDHIDRLLQFDGRDRRFTQDSPILPGVWRKISSKLSEGGDYSDNPRISLILTPHWEHSTLDLICHLIAALQDYEGLSRPKTKPAAKRS